MKVTLLLIIAWNYLTKEEINCLSQKDKRGLMLLTNIDCILHNYLILKISNQNTFRLRDEKYSIS